MERLKQIVKDEIKEIEKHKLSKASIVMLGELVDILKNIKEIERMDNMTKQKLRMYKVSNMYEVRENRGDRKRSPLFLILANFTYFAYSLYFSLSLLNLKKYTDFFHNFLKIEKHTGSRLCEYTKKQ